MEPNQLEQRLQESRLQTWERLMYVSLGSAVAIVFHAVDPLRDIILMVTLLYTTLAGFSLLWGATWGGGSFTSGRGSVIMGHLFASWLVCFGIYSYSRLPALGMIVVSYTFLLMVIYWRIRKRLSTSDEIFP